MILSGEVEVLKCFGAESQVIGTLCPGQYFGEMALLGRRPRSATTRALTRLDMLVLPGSDFSALAESLAEFRREFEEIAHRTKRWRQLDLGGTRCVIECSLRRLRCPRCGVHLEPVPWARQGAQHTRDFEDVVAWLAQQMAKTPIAGMLRIGWDTVGHIVERVIADHLDEERLEGLVPIGVDEIAYCRGQR